MVLATASLPFFVLKKTRIINQIERAFHSGPIRVKKSIAWQKSLGGPVAKSWKDRNFAATTRRTTTLFSSRTRMATSWKSVAARSQNNAAAHHLCWKRNSQLASGEDETPLCCCHSRCRAPFRWLAKSIRKDCFRGERPRRRRGSAPRVGRNGQPSWRRAFPDA